jgi:glycosyltransferase involved in cell wall biosynthesis
MRVLHINDYQTAGGAEVLADRIIKEQRHRGIEASLFTSESVPGYRRSIFNYINNRVARSALRKRIENDQPDIVHLHNFYHALSPGILPELASLKRHHQLRIVATAHDYHLLCPNSGMRFFTRNHFGIADTQHLSKLGYLLGRRWDHRSLAHSQLKLWQHLWHYKIFKHQRFIDLVISPSRGLQVELSKRGFNAIWIPNPAPFSTDKSTTDPPTLAKPKGKLHLVFAGRVEPEKGVAEFIENLTPDFEGVLTIVGEGAEVARCKAISTKRKLNDAVRFMGRQTQQVTINTIASAHVLILPSLFFETAGLTLLEALSVGTNILTSDQAGAAEIMKDAGIGYVYKPGDTTDLCKQLANIQKDHEKNKLNTFDASEFLASRNETQFVDQICQAYQSQ